MVVDRRCIDFYDRGGYLCPDAKGEIAGGSNRKDQSTNARRRGGAAHSRNEGSVMEERLQTASPRRSPAVTWSRVLSRCSTPTTMATGPAALQSLPCARHAQRCWRADWVLDIDVKGYFDSIDWELLLRAVRRHTDCPWVLLYIDRWLKAPVQVEDGSVVPRTAGTPQGGVVSPLLANLFLHYAFDMWMARTYPHIPFERYADDIICHCKSAEEARALWGALADRFAVCKLVLHPQKTKTVYCKDANRRGDFPSQSFDFLGLIPSEEDAMARTHPHARFPARSSTTSADVHQPGDPALGTSPSQRQVPARYGSMA